ncbi:DUF6816 family protein [Aliterella atlantica]|uniref:DUF6816 domain-containing protein n=1 Tax=Aliterella atlantica CENA595 TaxID=1618023 RepID=A0A0D8ZTR2_9CYAN|nr:hypothetical protein [Aliterella atlantica]KJH71752.1 hypothetical protein UH38_10160 [Aliterella atlantica CENA595]
MNALRGLWVGLLVLVWCFWGGVAEANQLSDRLASFPRWEKLSVQVAKGDLVYPDWMAGSWNVKSTLVDLAAPLAPDIVTPGFESNRRTLNEPVSFTVRFVQERLSTGGLKVRSQPAVVADRAFNGLNLARAYLDRSVIAVKVDPKSPNKQITLLKGDRALVSLVTGRATESPQSDRFVAAEVFQQLFKGGSQPYFNEVESTTAYQYLSDRTVEADQVTAVYLSPQEPQYFIANSRPVALYRYRLEFSPADVLPFEQTYTNLPK